MTNGDNDTFPLWWLQVKMGFRPDVVVLNISLLNTSCFVKYLKHKKGVPMTLSDEEIDKLRPIKKGDTLLLPAYQVIQNIIEANDWQRPVYYAVTLAKRHKDIIGYPSSLIGLAEKVSEHAEAKVELDELKKNLYSYKYDHVFNRNFTPRKELDCMLRKLVQNYISLFYILANELYLRNEKTEAKSVLKRLICMVENLAFNLLEPIGDLAYKMGEYSLAEKCYKNLVNSQPHYFRGIYTYAKFKKRIGQKEKGLKLLTRWIEQHPYNKEAVDSLKSFVEDD